MYLTTAHYSKIIAFNDQQHIEFNYWQRKTENKKYSWEITCKHNKTQNKLNRRFLFLFTCSLCNWSKWVKRLFLVLLLSICCIFSFDRTNRRKVNEQGTETDSYRQRDKERGTDGKFIFRQLSRDNQCWNREISIYRQCINLHTLTNKHTHNTQAISHEVWKLMKLRKLRKGNRQTKKQAIKHSNREVKRRLW